MVMVFMIMVHATTPLANDCGKGCDHVIFKPHLQFYLVTGF